MPIYKSIFFEEITDHIRAEWENGSRVQSFSVVNDILGLSQHQLLEQLVLCIESTIHVRISMLEYMQAICFVMVVVVIVLLFLCVRPSTNLPIDLNSLL